MSLLPFVTVILILTFELALKQCFSENMQYTFSLILQYCVYKSGHMRRLDFKIVNLLQPSTVVRVSDYYSTLVLTGADQLHLCLCVSVFCVCVCVCVHTLKGKCKLA